MSKFGSAPKCPVCKESVYFAEEVKASGKSYHKRCFRCKDCGKSLDSTTIAEHGDHIYCKNCHAKNFGTAGYGHGVGAGVLQTDHGGSVLAVSGQRAAAAQAKQSAVTSRFAGGPKCPRCGKTVYHAEKVTAVGKDWHKSCFTCASCKKTLEIGKVSDREGEIYCKGCYGKHFGPKGVGFGIGAGTLQT